MKEKKETENKMKKTKRKGSEGKKKTTSSQSAWTTQEALLTDLRVTSGHLLERTRHPRHGGNEPRACSRLTSGCGDIPFFTTSGWQLYTLHIYRNLNAWFPFPLGESACCGIDASIRS
ncbi:hypothetical protein MAP00_002664 [Monascus purpureus]|nr:hypothetical protein MAP00_002664 [Monascus purpureus]